MKFPIKMHFFSSLKGQGVVGGVRPLLGKSTTIFCNYVLGMVLKKPISTEGLTPFPHTEKKKMKIRKICVGVGE